MKTLLEALVTTRPDRLVWGSNRPHPVWNGFMPSDGDLVNLLCRRIPDEATRNRILVTNPAQLDGFE